MEKIKVAKIKNLLLVVFRYAFLIGLVFTILYPQLNKVVIAFRSDADLIDSSIIFLPKHFAVDSFIQASDGMDYLSTFFRTLFICASCALFHVIACTLTAYSIAKFDFRLKKLVYVCVILTFLVPPSLISLPIYTTFQNFDVFGIFKLLSGSAITLLDKPISLLLLYATANGLKSGLFVFLLVQYFKNMPRVLDEAAEVDGATNLQILLRIALPSARVMMVTVFLFTFVWQWTDTYYTSMFFTEFKVMSSALNELTAAFSNVEMSFVKLSQISSAGSVLFIIPLLILYLLCNKAFVQSIENSGIVG